MRKEEFLEMQDRNRQEKGILKHERGKALKTQLADK